MPLGPLEVVQERPDEITFEVHAPLQRLVRRPKVGFEKGYTLLISYFALRVDVVVGGAAVFGYVDRGTRVLLVQADEDLGEAVVLDRPAHRGSLGVVGYHDPRPDAGEGIVGTGVVFAHHAAHVVVDAEEVQGGRDLLEVPITHKGEVALPPVVFQNVLRVLAAKDGV